MPTATATVVGSVIGTGVFALPSAQAPYGPISLVAFRPVTPGALALLGVPIYIWLKIGRKEYGASPVIRVDTVSGPAWAVQ